MIRRRSTIKFIKTLVEAPGSLQEPRCAPGIGNYVDRVAKHECIILFLRQCGDESTPFYTMEIRDRRAVQVRGFHNCDPTPEVRKFVDRFERQVLRAA